MGMLRDIYGSWQFEVSGIVAPKGPRAKHWFEPCTGHALVWALPYLHRARS